MTVFEHGRDEWVRGLAPATRMPKTQDRLLKQPGEIARRSESGKITAIVRGKHPVREVGATYSIQSRRGQPGSGRYRVLEIREGDIRNLTWVDTRAEGYASRIQFMEDWCAVHDPEAVPICRYIDQLKQRPAAPYACWIIVIQAET